MNPHSEQPAESVSSTAAPVRASYQPPSIELLPVSSHTANNVNPGPDGSTCS